MAKSSGKDIRAGGAIITLEGIDKSLSKALTVGMAQVNGFAKAVGQKLSGALAGAGEGLSNVGGKLQAWGGSALAAGGAVTAAFGAAAFSFAQTGSQLDDLSQRTGVSAKEWSKLAYVAKMSGTSMETLEKGNLKLNQALAEAAGGSKSAREKFSAMGLSVEELIDMPLDARLAKIGDAINGFDTDAEKSAAAMDLFGKAGNELLPMLKSGPGGIADLASEAERLGVVMSDEDAAAAAKFGDAIDAVSMQLGAVTNQVGGAIAKGLLPFVDTVTGALKGVIDWTAANPGLIQTIAAVAAGVMAGGAALVGMGIAAATLGGILTGLGTVLGALAAAAAVFVSPLGIAAGIVAALVIDWQTLGDTGWAALTDLTTGFGSLMEQAKIAGAGIAAALQMGDLAAAGKIAMLGMQVVWSRVSGYFVDKWLSWKNFFLAVWDEASGALASLIVDAMFGVERAWNSVVTNLANGFEWFIEQAMQGWNWLLEAIDKVAGTDLKGMLGNSGQFGGGAEARAARSEAAAQRDEQLKKDQAQSQANLAADRMATYAEREKARLEAGKAGEAERKKLADEMKALSESTQTAAVAKAEEAAKIAAASRQELQNRMGPGGGPGLATGDRATGTFAASAALAYGFGGNSPMDRVAAATEATKKASEVAANKLDSIDRNTRRLDKLAFT